VVNGVPIGSTTDDTEPTAVWVTETVWPCEPSSLAAATGSGVGNVQKADYDTVPVDGGSNAEAVPEGAAESSSATRNPTSDPPMTSSSVDPPMPSSSVDPTTNDPPPSTTFPVMPYTPVTSDPMTVDPSSTYVQVDEQAPATDPIVSDLFTSDPVSSDPTTALPVPVFSTYTPDAFVASTTSIPAMPTLAPTIVFPSNGTNTTCTDEPDDEYTPAEESAYWATASGPSVSYSDYTTTITIKSTSTTTISITIPADDPAATSADPMPTARNGGLYSNITSTPAYTSSDITVDPNQAVVYTPVSDAFASTMAPVAISADPTTSTDPATSTDPTTSPETTMSTDPSDSPSATSPIPTSTDPSEETVSGTIITYIDDTTTITTTPTPDPSAATDSTSTTTVWTTSTIIIDSYTKRARRRHVLVTRS